MITTWSEAQEQFEYFLDEIQGRITLGCGSGESTLPASVWLRNGDPIAYRESFNAWADSEGIDTDELEGTDKLL